MMNLSGWSGNSLLRKIPLSSSPCYKQYKLLSVRLCTTGKIFRSLKGYTDMLYNTFHFSFVALLLLFFPSSIFFSIYAATVFSPERSHLTFPLHFRGCIQVKCKEHVGIRQWSWATIFRFLHSREKALVLQLRNCGCPLVNSRELQWN